MTDIDDIVKSKISIAEHSMVVDAAKNARQDRHEDAMFEIETLKRLRRKDKSFGLLPAIKDRCVGAGVLFKVPSKRRQQARLVEHAMLSAGNANAELATELLKHEVLFLLRNPKLSRDETIRSYEAVRLAHVNARTWQDDFEKKRPRGIFTAPLGRLQR